MAAASARSSNKSSAKKKLQFELELAMLELSRRHYEVEKRLLKKQFDVQWAMIDEEDSDQCFGGDEGTEGTNPTDLSNPSGVSVSQNGMTSWPSAMTSEFPHSAGIVSLQYVPTDTGENPYYV